MAQLMHERPLVYVAGPYTTPDPVENTNIAIRAGDRINAEGLATAFVPHLSLLWHIVCPHADVEYWYEFDLSFLARCDVLFRLPGKSSGADKEVEFALALGIPVFYDWDEMNDYLRWLRP